MLTENPDLFGLTCQDPTEATSNRPLIDALGAWTWLSDRMATSLKIKCGVIIRK